MTKNFEHDQKINTDEHLPSNLTKNIKYMLLCVLVYIAILKLIESPVKPSSILGASSQKI